MKFKKGDKVALVLIANKWGLDFTCYIGTLKKVEKKGQYSNPTATISCTKYIGLDSKQTHDPRDVCVDVRLFKMVHWNEEIKTKLRKLREVSQQLHALTTEFRAS